MAADLSTVSRLRGLALPATKGPGGYFESKTALDVAWGDLMIALFVPRGARTMRRSFGSALHEQLFEPAAEPYSDTLAFVIREGAAQCPHIAIRNVTIDPQENSIAIRITFALKTDSSNTTTRAVEVPKVHLSADLV